MNTLIMIAFIMNALIDRRRELVFLEKRFQSGKAELMVVYGRSARHPVTPPLTQGFRSSHRYYDPVRALEGELVRDGKRIRQRLLELSARGAGIYQLSSTASGVRSLSHFSTHTLAFFAASRASGVA
jgi:hypothetical protein